MLDQFGALGGSQNKRGLGVRVACMRNGVRLGVVIPGRERLVDGLQERSAKFIIRADGDVVSRDMIRRLWGDEFSDLRIYPGDTIVVPEKLPKASALYGVMNWSQMFSQFALGAAALDVIH